VDRAQLLDAFLEHLGERLDALDTVVDQYRARLGTLGRSVRVELAAGQVEGVATDVDALARLVVQPATGPPVVVAAGDVVHLRGVTDRDPTRPAR
jgi:biotin-(acetyl-CoA carboxylase) ligase